MQEKIKCTLKYVFESWELFQCDNCGKKNYLAKLSVRISWNLESAQKLSANFTCNLPGGSRTWQASTARLRQQPPMPALQLAAVPAPVPPRWNEGWQIFHLWPLMWWICPNNGQHPGKGRLWHPVVMEWPGHPVPWARAQRGRLWSPPPTAATAAGAPAGSGCTCRAPWRKDMAQGGFP